MHIWPLEENTTAHTHYLTEHSYKVTHAVAEQTADSPATTPDEKKTSHSYFRNALRVFSVVSSLYSLGILFLKKITTNRANLDNTPGIYDYPEK